MNRDFFIPHLTPAQARMMVAAARVTNLHLSREIIQKAGDDLLTFADFPGKPLDDIGLAICQFIADYNHRCAIPYDEVSDQIFTAIACMIPKDKPILFLCDTPFKWVRELRERISLIDDKNDDRCQYVGIRDLTPAMAVAARGRYVVANITSDHVGYEWLGKLFPHMVIYGETPKQAAFPFAFLKGAADRHAADILYPHVSRATTGDKNRRGSGNLLPLMGCFDKLVRSKKKNAENS